MAKKAWKAAKNVEFKAVLRLPELDQFKSAVLNTLASPESQRGYRQRMGSSSRGIAPNHGSPSTES